MVTTRNDGRPPPVRTRPGSRQNPSRHSKQTNPGFLRDSSDDENYDFSQHSDNESESSRLAIRSSNDIAEGTSAVVAGINRSSQRVAQHKRDRRRSAIAGNNGQQSKRQRRTKGNGPLTPRKSKSKPPVLDEVPAYDGVIPNWLDSRISVQCWEDIFRYAASDGSSYNIKTKWLVDVATTCKPFADPALSCLYRCPSIKNASRAKKLAALLDLPGSETWLNYRSRIEELHLDIHIIPQSILYQLIHPLSRLTELLVFTPFDQPPYRELERSIRWSYPDEVFSALGPADPASELAQFKPFHASLASWEWSGRLMGGSVPTLHDIGSVHESKPFQSLTRVSFTNFQLPSLHKTARKYLNEESERQSALEDLGVIESIANSIAKLTQLKHLVFESSTVVNGQMLPLLPKNLVKLDLINCWDVNSDDLTSFLQTHGHQLRSLTLHHNQSLSLEFLASLGDSCPDLRELNLNLSYYHLYDSTTNSEQMYDQVLLPNQVPHWPHRLRFLSVEHIPDWSVETAAMFLQSLIDSAPQLMDLRYLNIKSMLTIPWKQRADFRNSWRSKMEKVFLRHEKLPQDVRSLRLVAGAEKGATNETIGSGTMPAAVNRDDEGGGNQSPSQNSDRAKSLRRSRGSGGLSYRDPDTDEDESDKSASDEDASYSDSDMTTEKEGNKSSVESLQFRQGLCKYVNVTFDNQKVRELQYGMEDFHSDDDESEEEEWNGDFEEDDPVIQF